MGSQCTSPSRAQGGLGFHEQHYEHLSLLGTTYLVQPPQRQQPL